MASAGVAQSSWGAITAAAPKSHGSRPRPSLPPPSNATVDEAWKAVMALIDGFPSSLSAPQATASEATRSNSSRNMVAMPLGSSLSILRAGGLVDVLQAYVLAILDRKVRDEVAPHFWALLDAENRPDGSGEESHERGGVGDGGESSAMVDDEGSGGDGEGGMAPSRRSYIRVKRALLYVAREVDGHLTLVRLLDEAAATAENDANASSVNTNANANTNANTNVNHNTNTNTTDDDIPNRSARPVASSPSSSTHMPPPAPPPPPSTDYSSTSSIEARYRCAFTAQVMAGARGDFHGTMRGFFDRNLRFWHRTWLEDRRLQRRQPRRRGSEILEADEEEEGDGDGMDLSGTGENEGEAEGGGGAMEEDGGGGEGGGGTMERSVQGGEEEADEDEEEQEEEEEDSDDDEDDFSDMSREELLELWGVLRRLGWFSLLQDAFSGVTFSHVLAYVRKRCDAVYDAPVLEHVMAWKDQVLMRWISLLLHDGHPSSTDTTTTAEVNANTGDNRNAHGASQAQQEPPFSTSASFSSVKGVSTVPGGGTGAGSGGGGHDAAYGWAQRLGLAVHEAFCSARIAELFDIIADYPDSAVAIGELKTALGVTQQHQRLAVLLRESVRRRLLHPGANTHQIIDVYIATIKVLRILDPKDVLLETVAGPVRLYLQGRKDTVRCIVASLTDETSGDLYDELRRQDARPLDRDDASDEDDGSPVAPNWEPASRDADPASGSRGGGDILSMLVSIYGSKELFVTEYRLMLADKLVNNLAYDTDKEIQNLELLKLRFGESSMHHCDIMVRDVEESKRVNANVHERLIQLQGQQGAAGTKEEAQCLDAVMVSQHFWPHLLGEDMRLHPSMQDKLAEFSKAYSVIKNPRLLVWKKQLGVVQLTLEFGSVERAFSVSPLHATLIMHFEGKLETWRLADLAKEVDLPPGVVSKKMMLWVNQGVISESPGPVYRLIRDQTQQRPGGEGMDAMALENNTEAAVSADANDAESDKVIEQFLTGMLTNLVKLPLNRIHNSLKMFMAGGDNKYDKSLPELQQLLWRLCSEGKLEQTDGEYRLVK